MIKHIVMWKLKDFAEGKSSIENAKLIKEMIEGLKVIIPQIREAEVGININPSDAAFDVALYSSFDSKQDLDIYQQHPEHLKIGEFIAKIRTGRVVVDYEV